MTVPRNEQETIIRYDKEEGRWYLFTDDPTMIRKYKDKLTIISETEDSIDGYVDPDVHSGSFSVREKRKMTDEQKESIKIRFANAKRVNKE